MDYHLELAFVYCKSELEYMEFEDPLLVVVSLQIQLPFSNLQASDHYCDSSDMCYNTHCCVERGCEIQLSFSLSQVFWGYKNSLPEKKCSKLELFLFLTSWSKSGESSALS